MKKRFLFTLLMICFSAFVFAAVPDPGPAPPGYQYDAVDQSADNQMDTPSVARSMPGSRFIETGEITRAEHNYTVKSAQFHRVNAVARVDGPHEVGWRGPC